MQRQPNKQVTFFDWAVGERTVSNRVLETINALVDLSEAERCLEESYSRLGRPGHRASVMLRVMLLQHLYGLSDPQAEEQLADRLSFQKFVGLLTDEAVPDETSICRFRQRMIDCGLQDRLLQMLNTQLEAAGYLVRRTTLVDATLIESSRKRPDHQVALEGKAPDADARYTRKNNQRYYGYKAHVSADGDNQLVCRAKITPANVDDSQVFDELIAGPTEAVYADKIYDTIRNKAWLAERGMTNGILKKSHRYYPLTADDQQRNLEKSRQRQPIERVFAHFKRWQRYRFARYVGLAKNQLELTLKAVTYNLRRLVTLATA
jgi:IS5 family transposase